MNSLKLKFLGLTGLILVTAIIGTTWYNLQIQQAILEKVAAKHARLVADTVRNNIHADMTSGHRASSANTLPKIDGEPIVDSLRNLRRNRADYHRRRSGADWQAGGNHRPACLP